MSKKQRLALTEIFAHLPFTIAGDPAEQRVRMEAALTTVPLPDNVTSTPGTLGGVPVLTIDAEGVDSSKVVLHFHGGVYVLGSARAGAGLAAALGRHAGMRVISVDYRLAPENPYPAALEDAVAVYRAVLEQTPASQIAASGESAGGGLTAALLLRLREASLPLPTASVLLSPWVDLTLTGQSMTSKASVDPSVLTPEGLRIRVPDYLGGADPVTPFISPIFADLTGLPRCSSKRVLTRSCSTMPFASRPPPPRTTSRSRCRSPRKCHTSFKPSPPSWTRARRRWPAQARSCAATSTTRMPYETATQSTTHHGHS